MSGGPAPRPAPPSLGRIADLILLGAALACLAILAHGVLHRERYLGAAFSVAGHLLLPGLGAAGLLVLLRLPRAWRDRIALLLVVSLLALASVEGAALWLWSTKMERGVRALGLAYDGSTKVEAVRELRAQGIAAYPAIYGMDLLRREQSEPGLGRAAVGDGAVLPLSGIGGRTTVLCNEGKGWVTYESDAQGFHNPAGTWRASVRAVVVGDSFVHGTCVGSDEQLVAHLRRAGVDALNLGIGGNGPLLELATIREYASAIEPQVVVWCFYEGNDLADLEIELRDPLLRRYLDDPGFAQGLIRLRPALDTALERLADGELARDPDRDELVHTARDCLKLHHVRMLLGASFGHVAGDYASLQAVLQRGSDAVRGWGGRVVWVYLPMKNRYQGLWSPAPREGRRRVLDMAAEQGFVVVDMIDVFEREGGSPLRWYDVGAHYNSAGYALVARSVGEALAATP